MKQVRQNLLYLARTSEISNPIQISSHLLQEHRDEKIDEQGVEVDRTTENTIPSSLIEVSQVSGNSLVDVWNVMKAIPFQMTLTFLLVY